MCSYISKKTQILSANDKNSLQLASSLLKDGQLVSIPTETVYGLAANALDVTAVENIFKVKGRPRDNPLILHISDVLMWKDLVTEITEDASKLAEAFWPGPLTIILPKSDKVPLITTAGLDSVAVRMPSHPAALEIISGAGVPIAAPSANLSGSPSPTNVSHCADDLWGKVPLILDGGECDVGIESTVISLVGDPILLRPGKITVEELSAVLGKPVAISSAIDTPLKEGEKPTSPGMKYRHYAPLAKIILIDSDIDAFINELELSNDETFALVFDGEEKFTNHPCVAYGKEHDAQSQSHGLFKALRTLDELGAKLVFARCPDHNTASLGVYNRILRAAAFEVKKI